MNSSEFLSKSTGSNWQLAWQRLPFEWQRLPIHLAATGNTLITKIKIALYSSFSPENSSNYLKSRNNSALQPWLRQVCASDRPGGAKPVGSLPRSGTGDRFPSLNAVRFGGLMLALVTGLMLAAPVAAEGWTKTTSAAGWSGTDRFTAKAPAQTKARSFSRFLSELKGPEMDKLLALISRAESPRLGYESVHVKARVKPPQNPTRMTLGQIFTWIKKTPGQPHAIGRYQVIPDTLARTAKALNLTHSTRYDRRTQDLIARFLIAEAGYAEFKSGRLSRAKFMDKLARVWAGLPLRNGRSAYHGYAGNRATITRAQYERAMASIFPIRRAAK